MLNISKGSPIIEGMETIRERESFERKREEMFFALESSIGDHANKKTSVNFLCFITVTFLCKSIFILPYKDKYIINGKSIQGNFIFDLERWKIIDVSINKDEVEDNITIFMINGEEIYIDFLV